MTTHYWGDDSFDWGSLYKAQNEIYDICRKYGRVGIRSKEKYGTIRWEHIGLCGSTLHSFTHPGYVYSRYPKWLWRLDLKLRPLKYIAPIIRFWQLLVVQYAFTVTCRKYPHIIVEILEDAPKEILPPDLAEITAKKWLNNCKNCDTMSTTWEYICPNCGEEK